MRDVDIMGSAAPGNVNAAKGCRRRSCSRPLRWSSFLIVDLSVLFVSPVVLAGQAYHVGLDFVESTVASPPDFFYEFAPFTLTAGDNLFVSQGGLAGWTEQQVRREIVAAVDAAFRDIDSGDPNRTMRMTFYVGAAPSQAEGVRMNVALAQPAGGSLGLLGEARQWAINDPQVNDSFVAVAYLNEIDDLGVEHVTYDAASGVFNAIAGTTAHELGHVFGAVHVSASATDPDPLPLMAIESTGLPTSARLRERRFSTSLPAELSNADRILSATGTVPKGDLNLDGLVNEMDAERMFANWAMNDRLYHEGNLAGARVVNAVDAAVMFANWTSVAGTRSVGTAVPEPSTLALIALGIGLAVIPRWVAPRL